MPHRERALQITRALEALRVPSAVIDRGGRFRWLNRGAADFLGDRVGQSFSAVVAPEDRSLAREHFDRKLDGETDPTTYAMTLIASNGERVLVSVSSVPYWEGDRIA